MEFAEIKGEHSNMFTLILDEDSGVKSSGCGAPLAICTKKLCAFHCAEHSAEPLKT